MNDKKNNYLKVQVDQKMEEAKRMLTRGMTINAVSYTLCFCNESHFIQLFKKKYHMTPAAYVAGTKSRL